MSEFHATLAAASLSTLEDRLRIRREKAAFYEGMFASLNGVRTPQIRADDLSTYKDFTIIIDPEVFGATAHAVASFLDSRGIESRRYYDPPIHLMKPYKGSNRMPLPVAERTAGRVLSVPFWDTIEELDMEAVVTAISASRSFELKN
jgi:dTDP-4-amino-4,6-dideoxygalactose transaminase